MTGRAASWTTLVLAILCVGSGAAVVLELTGGLPLAPQVTAAPPPTPKLAWSHEPVAFEPPLRDGLEVIAERPLFSPSRRPFVEAPTEVAPASVESLPLLQLIGVLLTEQQRAALVQTIGEGEPSWVREGTEVNGWHVEQIEQSRVHLRAGDRLETVELRSDTAVPAKARPKRRRAEVEKPRQGEDADPAAQADEPETEAPEEEPE